MGSVRMILTLSIVTAVLMLMSLSYTTWLDDNNVNTENVKKCEVMEKTTILGDKYTSGLDCGAGEGDNLANWFNLVWVTPLLITLGYALIPFVK